MFFKDGVFYIKRIEAFYLVFDFYGPFDVGSTRAETYSSKLLHEFMCKNEFKHI